MSLNKLAEIYYFKLKENGYVGLDFNMALLCNLELKGIKTKLEFSGDRSNSINYWASKRRFGEILVNSADDIIKLALENNNLTANKD